MQNNTVIAALRKSGIATAAQLMQATGKSQATISRMLRATDAQIVRLGRARSARYAIPESILGLPAQMPLFWSGRPWGTLTFIAGNRIHVEAANIDLTTPHGELPWFLEHFRLQGFIGRTWAERLAFDANTEQWSLAQILFANRHYAIDVPGAISAGAASTEALKSVVTHLSAKGSAYDAIADDIGAASLSGSSAAGEQPKFLVAEGDGDGRRAKHLIVKFSPPRGTPYGERWHDLLCAEAIALNTLATHHLPSAETRLVHTPRRTYLESTRFDRADRDAKIHTLPLSAIHRGFVNGPLRNWADTCDALVTQRRLTKEDAFRVRVLLEYGRMIGNTDMHFGNLSLFAPDVAAARFSLAPAYDMLPMRFRPGTHRDELGYTPVAPTQATPGQENAWQRAHAMARTFWQTLASSETISRDWRDSAALSAKAFAQT